ncbi:MAG: tetratricopeptide repeat protein, partial [Gammaproteobacteria bacterium]|nr:tetratricopeptide repeat protein [Gammaproteobacteria bacterium]
MSQLPKQLQAAVDAHRRKDFAGAAAGYRRFLKRNDQEASVWNLLASAQLMRGKLPDAREAAARSVALDASKPGHHLLLVDVLLRQQEYAIAVEQCDRLLRLDDHNDEALWRKARALRLAGDLDAAMQVLQDDGTHAAPFLYEKGLALEQLDRLDQAENALQNAVDAEPEMALAWHALGVVQLKQGNALSAGESLSRASKLDPANAESKINLVTAVRLGGNIKGALLLSEALLSEHAGLADAHTQYAATLQAMGRFQEAEQEFLKARELQSNNVEALAGLAELAEWRGDYAGGLALLDEATELKAPDLIVSRARLLQRSGRVVEAADLLRSEDAVGVAWRPWHRAQAAFSLAHILDELGDYPPAFAAAKKANLIRGGRFDSAAHTRWVDQVIKHAPT